jgi:hypothetical protein
MAFPSPAALIAPEPLEIYSDINHLQDIESAFKMSPLGGGSAGKMAQARVADLARNRQMLGVGKSPLENLNRTPIYFKLDGVYVKDRRMQPPGILLWVRLGSGSFRRYWLE